MFAVCIIIVGIILGVASNTILRQHPFLIGFFSSVIASGITSIGIFRNTPEFPYEFATVDALSVMFLTAGIIIGAMITNSIKNSTK